MLLNKGQAPFTIRSITGDDLDEVLAVYVDCEDFLALGPTPKASMRMVLGDLEQSRQIKGTFCGIYLQDGRMAGVLDYVPAGHHGHPDQAYINLLMIGAPYRSQGLGQGVLAWVESLVLLNPEVKSLHLGCQVNNPAGLRFWAKSGFRQIGPPEDFPDGTTGIPFEKILRTD